MQDDTSKLYLYEALELRSEYDARIKTLKDCLPETKHNRSRPIFSRDEETITRPSPEFDVARARDQVQSLTFRRRKLNTAIQRVNFDTRLTLEEGEISLSEALELRSELNGRIGELHTQVVESAYERVIYKEGRDIVDASPVSYQQTVDALDLARQRFRELNRELRRASYQHEVDYRDEK